MKEKLESIISQLNEYFEKHNIKNIVIGNSGGIDSALCIAILSKCNINIISRYIHIDSNTVEEKDRATFIANAFNLSDEQESKSNHKSVDLTEDYDWLASSMISREGELSKIQQGNIKARIRMIYLYNLASKFNGIVCSTDNKTERELGFWTIFGDEGDIVPLYDLYKTEVYKLAEFMTISEHPNSVFDKDIMLLTDKQSLALQECINATPVDGLGITATDVEQLGAKDYSEVDLSLLTYNYNKTIINEKVIDRHLKSEFKRNHPKVIKLK